MFTEYELREKLHELYNLEGQDSDIEIEVRLDERMSDKAGSGLRSCLQTHPLFS